MKTFYWLAQEEASLSYLHINATAHNLTVQAKPIDVFSRYSFIDGDIRRMYLALTPARKAQLKIKFVNV